MTKDMPRLNIVLDIVRFAKMYTKIFTTWNSDVESFKMLSRFAPLPALPTDEEMELAFSLITDEQSFDEAREVYNDQYEHLQHT